MEDIEKENTMIDGTNDGSAVDFGSADFEGKKTAETPKAMHIQNIATLEGEGVAVKVPPARPKTIKEASVLARELFER